MAEVVISDLPVATFCSFDCFDGEQLRTISDHVKRDLAQEANGLQLHVDGALLAPICR